MKTSLFVLLAALSAANSHAAQVLECDISTNGGMHITPDHQPEVVNEITAEKVQVTIGSGEQLITPTKSAFLGSAIVVDASIFKSRGTKGGEFDGNLQVGAYFFREKGNYTRGNPGRLADATASLSGKISEGSLGAISHVGESTTYLVCRLK
jgi:hypothetical protein